VDVAVPKVASRRTASALLLDQRRVNSADRVPLATVRAMNFVAHLQRLVVGAEVAQAHPSIIP
jgi:hypothetical protein